MPSAQDAARCVFCRCKPVDAAWRPFCSQRCKTADLANWADQSYRVAGHTLDDAAADVDEDSPDFHP